MPVGLFFQAKYEGFETVLAPGDRLLLVSDGVTEVEDREGRQLGEDGLDRLMRGLSALQGPEFLQGLVDRLTDRDGADFADDVSAALIERS